MSRFRVGFLVSGLISLMFIWNASLAGGMSSVLERAVAALSTITGREQVQWNIAEARTTDVTCDGNADVVMFGIGNHSVWMGVVPSGGSKPQGMRFPYPSRSQDGFSNRPTRINLFPFHCETQAAGRLVGCRSTKRCMAFDLDDGETDPFNFYWDNEHKRLRWWRN